MSENVNHPKHYNAGKIEVIEFIEDQGFGPGFHIGNAIKYAARAGKKDPTKTVEDLQKATWYLNRWVEVLKAKEEGREPVRPNAMNARVGIDPAAPGADQSVEFRVTKNRKTVFPYGEFLRHEEGCVSESCDGECARPCACGHSWAEHADAEDESCGEITCPCRAYEKKLSKVGYMGDVNGLGVDPDVR